MIIAARASAVRTWLTSAVLAMASCTFVASEAAAIDIPADMRIDLSSVVVSKEELVCLALNDYYEARSESLAGRIAVARVVLNRVMDSRFPSNICEVVKQTSMQNNQKHCQFSWFCETRPDTISEPDQWRESLKIATAVLQKDCAIPDPTGGALWYHADFTRPAWAVGYESTTIIGNHVFYRDGDNPRNKTQVRRPFIYRLNAFAESVAKHAAKPASAYASTAPDGSTAVAIQGGPAPTEPLAR